MRIRPATPDDAQTLWRAEVETAGTAGRLISRPHELLLGSFEAKLRELEGRGSYVVAVHDERIIGHAVLEPMSLEALQHVYRLTIVVHSGSTGQGVGTALIEHLLRWAEAQPDLVKVELMVRSTNQDAIRLYQRVGFVEEGRFRQRVRFPDGVLVDDVAMAWFPR